jgi:hypothetical protein
LLRRFEISIGDQRLMSRDAKPKSERKFASAG